MLAALFLVAATVTFVRAAVAPAEVWQKVVAPQFTLYSSAKGADALRAAEDFQQFIGALGEIVPLDSRSLPPLTIVMFGNESGFRPFRPRRPNGKPWDVAGFFSRQEGWAVFGLTGTRLDDEVRRTVLHEGVHWYLSGFELPNPPWLEEGLAEVFSTFMVAKHRREWGQPIGEHVRVLRASKAMPLERLLGVSRADPLFNEVERTGLFYAESWAFVHFLLFGEHNKERTLFNEYLKAFRIGIAPDKAFKTVFGADFATMDRALEKYLDSGRYFVGSRAVSSAASGLKVERAGDVEREIALARLAIGAQRLELAQEHVVAAVGAGPETAAVSEVKGYLADARGDVAEMLASFAEAAKRGSKDYQIYFGPAQRRLQTAEGLDGSLALAPAEARQIADGYERTIELRPWFLPAYQGLARVQESLAREDRRDRASLDSGWRQFPGDGLIRLGLAATAHRNSVDQEAERWLDQVLAQPEKYPASVTGYARQMAERWAFDSDYGPVQILLEARRYSAALVALDALFAKGVPVANRSAIAVTRANIVAGLEMEQAQAAWDESRWSAARTLLEAVVASRIQTGVQYEARRRLAELDRRHLGRE